MATKTTPIRFATDITNIGSASSSSSFAASSSKSSRPPKVASRTSYRQTSLADSFFRSSSPIQAPVTASTPATSTFDATRSSSPCGRDQDEDFEMEIAEQGLDYDEAEQGGGDTRDPKRRRTVSHTPERGQGVESLQVWDGADLVANFDASFDKGKQRMESTLVVPGTQMSAFQAMRRRELGFHSNRAHVSMRPYLTSLVSSNEDHVARIPSLQSHRDFSPPFALAFSHDAKAGGKQVAAVADEEGSVSILSSEGKDWYMGPTKASFRAHANAIFDCAWSRDDQVIATASGDQTVRLHDVETKTCVGVLSGHTCTVKNVAWDPHNPQMLSTASRDGSIRIWDRRVRGYAYVEPEGSAIGTVNHIKNAHGALGKKVKGRSATRSVTAVNYLLQQDNLLASAGSADSVVKIWDLRRSHSRRVNPAFFETNEEAVSTANAARPHGIASMQLAPDGRKLYALSTDSQIYAFDPLNLTHPAPLSTFVRPLPTLSAASFYVRCAISPDSRFLASGSADGSVYIWDVEGNGTDAVRIKGHEKEVSGLDWSQSGLGTCSDDFLVRQWRFDTNLSRRRSNPDNCEDVIEAAENRRLFDRWSGEYLAH